MGLPLPALRTASGLVRRSPRPALGRRWRDLAVEPGPALPTAPPGDPSWLRSRDGGRAATRLHPTRRLNDRRQGATDRLTTRAAPVTEPVASDYSVASVGALDPPAPSLATGWAGCPARPV